MSNIYQRIHAHLKTQHMSRRQLAIAAGIPESTLACAFTRGTRLKPEMIQRIASVLNVDWIALAGYESTRSSDPYCNPSLIAALNDLRSSIDNVLEVIKDMHCENEEIPTPVRSRNGDRTES